MLGKTILDTRLDLQITDAEGKYWKGAWDGGYGTDSSFVGLGFKIWVTDKVEIVDGLLQLGHWIENIIGVGSVKEKVRQLLRSWPSNVL